MTFPHTASHTDPLRAELEAAALRQLSCEWHNINDQFFRFALRPVTFLLLEGEGRLGFYDPRQRRIALSRTLVFGHPWGHTVEVLKHEMAHQFVYEVLRVHDETAHGRAFQEVCARLGIDAAASGLPRASPHSDEEQRVLERIARLLALAESSNEHEAQAAMNAAQRLMLKHNLATVGRPATYQFRHLGVPSGRILEADRWLATILNEHFFVETIWIPVFRPELGKRGTILEICGTPANLDMAAYVHSFLRETAEHLWNAHKKSTRECSNRERQRFLSGVMQGFLEKLREQAKRNEEQGLIWVKDGNLEGYFRQRHPRVRTVRYQGANPSEAYERGKEAGRSIVLYRPITEGSSDSIRLLGPGSR
ncbi:MAG: DUF2786 domain-containing protein [Myxococcales bacterium]|nr:SprT-like domain-containing protein [Polyangiaceae bacterium]MDW8249117.1 DUF2786 domain-containing protein [Myxococcales bacterium]